VHSTLCYLVIVLAVMVAHMAVSSQAGRCACAGQRPSSRHGMGSSLRLVACHATPAAASSSSSSAPSTSGRNASARGGDDLGSNKVPVAMTMTADVYAYLLKHTREPEVLAKLRAETASVHGSHMQITPEQGQLLALLVEVTGAKKAIEVGVFTGYSSLAVAMALPPGGKLVALDKDAGTMAMARRYWQEAGVADKVVDMLGPALDSLNKVLETEGPDSYDFAFIDADKRVYWQYYELLLKLVRPGGLIVVDNVLFYGKVADPNVTDKATAALRDFNERVMKDERVSLSIIPVGDGVALCRKR